MRYLLYGVAIMVTLGSPAKALDLNITLQQRPMAWDWGVHPQVQHLPPMTDAQRAEDQRWQEFCKPVRNRDRFGVIRLTYAHEGCEFGRTD